MELNLQCPQERAGATPATGIVERVWDKSLTLNIKSEQNELSDTQNTVLFAFLSNLSILKIYNKEFLKSKSFCPNLSCILAWW